MSTPEADIAAVSPGLPIERGEPLFHAPWQAKAFALTVKLHEKRLFTWSEWAEALSRALAANPVLGDGAGTVAYADAYFAAWTEALERLLESRGVTDAAHLQETAETWKRAAEATPHGQPIEFRRGIDYL